MTKQQLLDTIDHVEQLARRAYGAALQAVDPATAAKCCETLARMAELRRTFVD